MSRATLVWLKEFFLARCSYHPGLVPTGKHVPQSEVTSLHGPCLLAVKVFLKPKKTGEQQHLVSNDLLCLPSVSAGGGGGGGVVSLGKSALVGREPGF